ncbi:Uncharacterised protein [Metamycoplasma arthritidis]|uniref:DUF2188 domain-containing protein n=1 Tax=Metamycoplasma arthritidis (strain 158L3-1) TaxID=243272 RepID=B3PMJ9_META1|nr:DUF2188 domain-containing protein [Metamycoplasma arthritidis]ACF07251.1 conserved hypothetical protein [Metamycoplasma arthritidis 158L3-1]VEU78774.1 Uncharacterised protein [Metamycoplasma arthritidis]
MPVRYVVNHENGWAVKNPKGKRALKTFKTQKEAMDYAKSLSDTTSVLVQSKEGSFRKS